MVGNSSRQYNKNNDLKMCEQLEEIYLYKIEFLMHFFKPIILIKIYEHLSNEYKLFFNIFPRGSLTGFF